jgi:hypothetical protein
MSKFLLTLPPRRDETRKANSRLFVGGDPKITKAIIINDTLYQVTTNLEAACRHLRSKGYGRLWVDAVCINQEDKVEKSQQLLLIGSIYRRAKEVAAWTGEEDYCSNVVMDALHSSGDFRRPAPSFSAPLIDSLINFLERPYWRRVWVIQELALSKYTTIHCGGKQTSWTRLSITLSSISSKKKIRRQVLHQIWL